MKIASFTQLLQYFSYPCSYNNIIIHEGLLQNNCLNYMSLKLIRIIKIAIKLLEHISYE